ncbi:MAG: protein phosphatase 2C domain-containing protein [Clostridium sp.]|nr:protein phosphatase 2C domain-containing protein [Bacteroides sp.]MCM1197412.1 protein phosphatase 2C domain-containing protein [Clostridium sp.]
MSNDKIKFRIAAYTDPAGKWNEDAPKKGNEDDLFVDADLSTEVQGQFMADEVISLSKAGCLLAVADGMGGMNAGEVASAIAIKTVKSAFCKDKITEEVLSSTHSRTRYLEKTVIEADAAIKKKSTKDKDCEGMGSTIILAWLYDNQLTVTWCGDSRAYIYRDGKGIRQVSKDHSYVQGLVDAGSITEEQAFDHPYGNIITKSLGDPDKKAAPDSMTVPIYKGDIILLCSDGLSGVLRDRKSYDSDGQLLPGETLEDIISSNRSSMTECRESLWQAAENAGWYDNVTAILCEIVDGEDNTGKQVTENDNRSIEKSFINVRLSKKSLKITVLVCIALLLCAMVFWTYSKFIAHPKLHNEHDVHLRDSLFHVSDSLGIIFIKDSLDKLDDINTEMLSKMAEELEIRKEQLAELNPLILKSDTFGLPGIARTLSSLIDSVKISKSPSFDLKEIKKSIDTAERLLMEIKTFLLKYKNLSHADKESILDFKNKVIQKEHITESDINDWNSLSQKKLNSMHRTSETDVSIHKKDISHDSQDNDTTSELTEFSDNTPNDIH